MIASLDELTPHEIAVIQARAEGALAMAPRAEAGLEDLAAALGVAPCVLHSLAICSPSLLLLRRGGAEMLALCGV